jgi:GR25 family glycosyltransferase involved in LPS biosynthesis
MDLLPHVLFINLDIRTDRLKKIENELKMMGLVGERIPAHNTTPQGLLGCALSHIDAIKIAREREWPYVLIFEDDFQFVVDKLTFEKSIHEFFSRNIDFDVLLLSYNLKQSVNYDDIIGRATSVQTTSGYIVHSRFYDTLLNNLQEGYEHLLEKYEHSVYAIDQYWKKLQTEYLFYFFKDRIGIQRADYSNIERKFVKYNM